MQWWSALTGQFQQIAANAMSDVSKLPSMDATRGMAAEALKTATDMATQFAAQGMQGMQDMQDAARQATEAGTGGARHGRRRGGARSEAPAFRGGPCAARHSRQSTFREGLFREGPGRGAARGRTPRRQPQARAEGPFLTGAVSPVIAVHRFFRP